MHNFLINKEVNSGISVVHSFSYLDYHHPLKSLCLLSKCNFLLALIIHISRKCILVIIVFSISILVVAIAVVIVIYIYFVFAYFNMVKGCIGSLAGVVCPMSLVIALRCGFFMLSSHPNPIDYILFVACMLTGWWLSGFHWYSLGLQPDVSWLRSDSFR